MPNSALRYRPPLPPDELRALYAKYSIGDEPAAVTDPLPATTGRRDRAECDDRIPDSAPTGIARPRRSPTTASSGNVSPDNDVEPVKVALGITDHAYTEVVADRRLAT